MWVGSPTYVDVLRSCKCCVNMFFHIFGCAYVRWSCAVSRLRLSALSASRQQTTERVCLCMRLTSLSVECVEHLTVEQPLPKSKISCSTTRSGTGTALGHRCSPVEQWHSVVLYCAYTPAQACRRAGAPALGPRGSRRRQHHLAIVPLSSSPQSRSRIHAAIIITHDACAPVRRTCTHGTWTTSTLLAT
jgi:hypothetical protein